MKKRGRPLKFKVEDIIIALNKYINEIEQPFIQEFALNYDISREHLYELSRKNKDLSDTIKKAIEKQELYMLKNASERKIDPTFTIFRLKQPCFGYKDKHELDQNINQDIKIKINLQD